MADLQLTALAAVLKLLKLVLFGLALGLTIISFQAYRRTRTKRLETAFIGFAFISMGVALTGLRTRTASTGVILFEMAETIPFIVGFTMLYLSLYR